MIRALTVNCTSDDLMALQGALYDRVEIEAGTIGELASASAPPDVVMLGMAGYGRNRAATPAERQAFLAQWLARDVAAIRQALPFLDVPILLVGGDGAEMGDCVSEASRASGALPRPFAEAEAKLTLGHAMMPRGAASTIDARIVNAFVHACHETLSVFAGLDSVRRAVLLKRDYRCFSEVSAVMRVFGDEVNGAIAVTFTRELAQRVVAAILGLATDALDDSDVLDGVGEMANTVTGQVKESLAVEYGQHFDFNLPEVRQGIGEPFMHSDTAPSLAIVMETGGQPFAVQAAIEAAAAMHEPDDELRLYC